MTWKIVGAAEASVLYIYIDYIIIYVDIFFRRNISGFEITRYRILFLLYKKKRKILFQILVLAKFPNFIESCVAKYISSNFIH